MDKVQLVKQCQSGDREAFGILYQTYLAPMREVVAYYIHNIDIEQDVLHDGFLIAFTAIGSLENSAKIEAWLTTIMRNLSLQYLKDESSHVSVPMSDIAIDDISTTSDEVHELTWEELDKIIDKLPEGYGKVFRLAVLDGLSHKEIGELLGRSREIAECSDNAAVGIQHLRRSLNLIGDSQLLFLPKSEDVLFHFLHRRPPFLWALCSCTSARAFCLSMTMVRSF